MDQIDLILNNFNKGNGFFQFHAAGNQFSGA
jgi:hypothetical protein